MDALVANMQNVYLTFLKINLSNHGQALSFSREAHLLIVLQGTLSSYERGLEIAPGTSASPVRLPCFLAVWLLVLLDHSEPSGLLHSIR